MRLVGQGDKENIGIMGGKEHDHNILHERNN